MYAIRSYYENNTSKRIILKDTQLRIVITSYSIHYTKLYEVQALKTEKKLYPKIELSELLCSCGQPAIKALIKQLGKIGNNQHKQIPNKQFQKKSYPLPRDLAASYNFV